MPSSFNLRLVFNKERGLLVIKDTWEINTGIYRKIYTKLEREM
jgi:hypothetical protein